MSEEKLAIIARTTAAVNVMQLFGSRVLVATYVRSSETKSKGGIIFIDKTREEDKHQGKIGLVVALGHHAFKDKDFWNGQAPEVGDWVMYNIQDTRRLILVAPDATTTADAQIECRIMEDTAIQGVVDDPTVVY